MRPAASRLAGTRRMTEVSECGPACRRALPYVVHAPAIVAMHVRVSLSCSLSQRGILCLSRLPRNKTRTIHENISATAILGGDANGPAIMGFKCGIVGLPNVGKSTLFNALTQTAAAQAANYPFCTIEPNVGDVAVPDDRLEQLAAIAGSKEIIPTRLTFVDIAGLVRGASKGEGLGNQFLANIRECDAVAHVVRCFEDGDITHVEGKVAPINDIEIIETELMLADLESLEKRVLPLEKKAKTGDKEAKELADLMNRCLVLLREGKPARLVQVAADERKTFETLGLLSSKPVLYVCNVEEASADKGNAFSELVKARAAEENAVAVVVSAKIESEIAVLPAADQKDYLEAVGLEEPGLNRVIRAGYTLLDLVTYFTVGPKEARAWTIEKGTKGPAAAGVIHSDFEKGYIRAETIAYPDYIANKGEAGAREAGKFRLEGKEYVVADGDVLHFRFAN
jgi:GTP-binding protein YchF